MATQIVCAYKIQSVGANQPSSAVATAVAAVLLTDVSRWGLRVSSDATTGPVGTLVTRTITLAMGPSAAATITAQQSAQNSAGGGGISGLTVTGAGLDYIKPPVLQIAGQVPAAQGGVQARGHATLGVFNSTLVAGGSGYSMTPTAKFSGGQLAPGGKQATATVNTDGAGHLTSLTIVTAGGPYNVPPTVTITDATGTGGSFIARLGVTGAVVDNPGFGYGIGGAAITVTVLPFFKSQFPDAAGNQAAAVANWMTKAFEAALMMKVFALAPVVS